MLHDEITNKIKIQISDIWHRKLIKQMNLITNNREKVILEITFIKF